MIIIVIIIQLIIIIIIIIAIIIIITFSLRRRRAGRLQRRGTHVFTGPEQGNRKRESSHEITQMSLLGHL